MTDPLAAGLAQLPLIWIVICEIFFLVYMLREDGLTFQMQPMIQRMLPMAKILFFALFGSIVGFLFLGFFSQTAGWIGFFLGGLPAARMIDRLLCQMRPDTRAWRWTASLIAGVQAIALLLSLPA